MNNVKSIGKDAFNFYDVSMEDVLRKDVQLTNVLRKAIDNNELYLVYQPQVSTETEEIIGLEALIRWQSKEFGLISPFEFIPLVEKSGLIHDIGKWVLQSACRQNKYWQSINILNVRVAVNVSFVQFRDPTFDKIVKDIIDISGLDPKFLEVEITEGTAIIGDVDVISTIKYIRNLGVQIAIDDFGAEHSSFARHKAFPFDYIKLDKSLIDEIATDDKNSKLISSVVQFAHELGFKTIVEGVEDINQYQELKRIKCVCIQGYYFFKPMKVDDLNSYSSN